jgi:cytochrome c553
VSFRLALLTVAVVLTVSRATSAHFLLVSPESWAEQDGIGNPQKTGACGEQDPGVAAVATGAVTAFRPGQVITVTVDETVFHPGHYRASLSATGRAGLPPMPETEWPGTCSGLEIQNPPIFPVLADGMLVHTEPFEAPQSFQVTLPSDVTCERCTLQVLEFMQSDVGASDNCFYRHCADISISSDVEPTGGAEPATASAGCSFRAPRRPTPSVIVTALFSLVALWRRRTRGSQLLALGAMAATTACGDGSSPRTTFPSTPGDVERSWLSQVGSGAEQTDRVCARGASDPIARELCRSPRPPLTGLSDLYALLGITPGAGGDVAVTTHSLGLSARTVSDLNPRTVVFRHYSPLDENQIAAVAFSRGAPFVELVGFDPVTRDFNFYLLHLELACADTSGGCGPRDLLTERLETGWRAATLYAEPDLEDTALDCSSCHRPDGAGTPARLLMRQIAGPWMHWGDFRALKLPKDCTSETGGSAAELVADGAEILTKLDGSEGRHGGVPIAELVAASSGYDLSSFIFYAAGHADGSGDVPCEPPSCVFSEPHPFAAQDVLCERLQSGSNSVPGGVWDRYRSELRSRGLPVPYFEHHIVSEPTRTRVADDFTTLLLDRGAGDAFSRLSGLVNDEVARAIGFLPDESASAQQLLTEMCVRCHDDNVRPDLRRSRFRATALEELDRATARSILDRISLPETSQYRMPPPHAGTLPDWAIARIGEFLERLARSGMAIDSKPEHSN